MMVELSAHPYMAAIHRDDLPLVVVSIRDAFGRKVAFTAGRYYQTTERRTQLLDHLCGPYGRPSQR